MEMQAKLLLVILNNHIHRMEEIAMLSVITLVNRGAVLLHGVSVTTMELAAVCPGSEGGLLLEPSLKELTRSLECYLFRMIIIDLLIELRIVVSALWECMEMFLDSWIYVKG